MVKISIAEPETFGVKEIYKCGKCEYLHCYERVAEECCKPIKKQERKAIKPIIYPQGSHTTKHYEVALGDDTFRVAESERHKSVDGELVSYFEYDVRKDETNDERVLIIKALQDAQDVPEKEV